jgi:putative transposase
MSRIARIVLEGVAYHVTQRGNGRQQVFFEDRDYRLYLDLLRDVCQRERLPIWAYCLMPNHIHLIAVLGGRRPWSNRWAGSTAILRAITI